MENKHQQDEIRNNESEEKETDTQTVQTDIMEEDRNKCANEKCESSNESVNITGESETNALEKTTMDVLNNLLDSQEELFNDEKDIVEMKRQTAKGRVNHLFEKVQEIFLKKKEELLGKIDTECNTAAGFLTDIISNIERDKEKLRDSGSRYEEADFEKLNFEIKASSEVRKDILNQFQSPNLVLNENLVEYVKRVKFGGFQETVTAATDEINPENKDDCNQESDAYESALESEDYLEDGDSETVLSEDGIHSGDGEGSEKNKKQNHDVNTVSFGSTVTPTKAPMTEGEECPTPYWKAMGLSKPPEVLQPLSQADNGNLPDNKLQHEQSFSLSRLHSKHKLMPVAMSWNRGRICVADRANTKIGFFYPSGELITEMSLECTELRDMTFLDETYGETRYVLTSPKSKTLMIIGIDVENATRMIQKLDSPHRYSYICRGPRPWTLLGAKVASKSNKSIVHMFTLAGQILLSITHTPSYNQLQCVKGIDVFGSNIIVLDGSINSVSVYQDDGRTVGEYRGTQEVPLVNPLDMTLDTKGNIMILNGEFSNIHVIDLHCSLIEIIKIPKCTTSKSSSRKLIAFDTESRRLSVAQSNGDIAIFTFKNGYDCLTQRKPDPCLALPHQNATNIWEPAQEVVPLVEGMVPSTIEDIMSRQRGRNRTSYRQFPT